MKKYITIFTLAIVAFSCDDMEFLQPDPPSLLTEEAAFQTINGVDLVIASGYNRMINVNNYGQYMMVAPDALAGNLEIGQNTGRYTGEVAGAARATFDIMNDPSNPTGAAFTVRSAYSAYRAINDANLALYGLNELALRDEDPDLGDRLEGEAKFIRALSYFDLMRVYAYEPGNEVGGWDEGVVLRTTAVIGASDADDRARSTNTEVYAQIEQDLLDAVSLLETEANTPSFPARASSTAARALLARVYLYLGQYGDAATQADLALGATGTGLVSAANYVASWSATNHPEAIFELNVSALDWNTVDGVNNSLASITRAINASLPAAQGAVKASDELIASYEAGDVRASLLLTAGADYVEVAKWNGELGDYRENIPLIRYSEVLLIAAEAKARSGDEPGARTDINALRAQRGLAATAATGSALTDLIMNERNVELVLEGHRFFDLKRLGLTIPKAADVGVSNIAPTDFRILADINNDYLSVNSLMVQNPGY